jgi:hypothetical protein
MSTLSPAQRRALREEGFVLLPQLVARDQVDDARRTINAHLGQEGMPKDQLPVFRARTFTPELCTHPAITGLFTRSPLGATAEAAIGIGKMRAPGEAQIALRFPSLLGTGAGSPAVPHIDGISSPGNGVPPGTLFHFTALAAVFLSQVDQPDRGNLTVWPGSHRRIEAYLRTHGPTAIVDRFPDLDLGPSHAVRAQPGDALLAHYALAHGIAPNLGPDVRYAVFFRLFHSAHESFGARPLTDLWLEWDGLREPPGT